MKNFLKNQKACPPSQVGSRRGITAIELLAIAAVFGILIVIALPQFSNLRESQVLKSGVQDTLSSIDKARVRTLSSLNSSEYGVHFQSDKVIIFTGTVFSAMAGDNEEIDIVSPVSITDVTIDVTSGSSGEIYFNRLSGAPSDTASITLSTGSSTKVITISATGVASVN